MQSLLGFQNIFNLKQACIISGVLSMAPHTDTTFSWKIMHQAKVSQPGFHGCWCWPATITGLVCSLQEQFQQSSDIGGGGLKKRKNQLMNHEE